MTSRSMFFVSRCRCPASRFSLFAQSLPGDPPAPPAPTRCCLCPTTTVSGMIILSSLTLGRKKLCPMYKPLNPLISLTAKEVVRADRATNRANRVAFIPRFKRLLGRGSRLGGEFNPHPRLSASRPYTDQPKANRKKRQCQDSSKQSKAEYFCQFHLPIQAPLWARVNHPLPNPPA